jgi:N-acetyl sugar amidotransferase
MSEYRLCARCVMDTTAGDITFDADGVCNYCTEFVERLHHSENRELQEFGSLENFVAHLKRQAKGKEYDCVLGVSGGVDSSYALLLAVKQGLKPLAVHLDNGWNSELASHNIGNLVTKLGVDLYTHVIDWEENRDLQRSFFNANVVDIELLMDNAMLAVNYEQAARYGLKYILSGTNTATEGLQMPAAWNHNKLDVRNIRGIQKRFGTFAIKTHPLFSTLDRLWYGSVRGIRWMQFLNLVNYVKADALKELEREVGYKPYPYKHYESVFTRFYQAVILPKKFGFDKRRVHLSALVMTGQITRAQALQLLTHSPYPDPGQEEQDTRFVKKKLGFSDEWFEGYLRSPGVSHQAYPSEKPLWDALNSVRRFVKTLRGTRTSARALPAPHSMGDAPLIDSK